VKNRTELSSEHPRFGRECLQLSYYLGIGGSWVSEGAWIHATCSTNLVSSEVSYRATLETSLLLLLPSQRIK